MKKALIVALVAVLVVAILGISGCLRPIFPGSSVEIIYPADGAVVPTDFSIVGVATKWSFGIETQPLLFLAPPRSHVRLSPVPVVLSMDGVEVADGGEGNHHLFRITAAPGDHTLVLSAPSGESRITVHVTDEPPLLCEPFDRTPEYTEAIDGLERALSEYAGGDGAGPSRGIYPAGGGAFVLFGEMEIRYIDLFGRPPTAADFAAAPVVFSLDQDRWGRPVRHTAVEPGGDRIYVAIIDDEALTLFSVFPDGTVGRATYPLAEIASGLAEAVAATPYLDVRTHANGDFFFLRLIAQQPGGPTPPTDILLGGGPARTVDLGEKEVDGITPDGGLITLYPAPFVGPFDSVLIDDTGQTSVYLPLPGTDEAFSFTGGSVHDIDRFYPEYPRFELSPVVPCADCTAEYVPPHHGIAGDVRLGPDILKSSIGGREEYFIMRSPKQR